MKARSVILIAGVALALAGPAQPAVAQVRVGIGVEIGPPPVRTEVVAPRPAYPAEWVRGYWMWDPAVHRHVWVEGRWVRARPGYRWVDGGWRPSRDGWVWTEGRWRSGRLGRGPSAGEPVPERGGERR